MADEKKDKTATGDGAKKETDGKKPEEKAKKVEIPKLTTLWWEFAKTMLFHGMFFGLLAVGIYLASTAVATGSLFMFFTGVAIGVTSMVERKALMEDKGAPIPGFFGGIFDLFVGLKTRSINKEYIKEEKLIAAKAKAILEREDEKAKETKATAEAKREVEAGKSTETPTTSSESEKKVDFAKEIVEAELGRKFSDKSDLSEKSLKGKRGRKKGTEPTPEK